VNDTRSKRPLSVCPVESSGFLCFPPSIELWVYQFELTMAWFGLEGPPSFEGSIAVHPMTFCVLISTQEITQLCLHKIHYAYGVSCWSLQYLHYLHKAHCVRAFWDIQSCMKTSLAMAASTEIWQWQFKAYIQMMRATLIIFAVVNLRRTKLFHGTRKTKRGNYLPQQIV